MALRADVPRGQYNLALVHEQRGNGGAARAAYEAEIAAEPEELRRAVQPRPSCCSKEGRLPEATARFRAAVEARPEFAEGYLYLAKALLDAGDLQGAEQAANEGLASQPDRVDRAARPLRARRRLLAAWAARTRRPARWRWRSALERAR